MNHPNEALAGDLILDELFDLSLYRAFREISSGHLRDTLEELIPIETRHYGFWQDFFQIKIERMDLGRRMKLRAIVMVCRLFGEKAIYLILEAIEIYGIRKYLKIWNLYQETPLSGAVKTILQDEFEHEDSIVSGFAERQINPEKIRSIFLGFNDGLVEFMGAVSGFFAAFQDAGHVLIASFTGAAAGAISMAIGSFLASSSEKEMKQSESEKQSFLTGTPAGARVEVDPFRSALLVGFSYLVGSMVPILPVFFGAKSVLLSWISGGAMAALVSLILAFISGMDIKKRVLTNLALLAAAIGIAYLIGILVKRFLGV